MTFRARWNSRDERTGFLLQTIENKFSKQSWEKHEVNRKIFPSFRSSSAICSTQVVVNMTPVCIGFQSPLPPFILLNVSFVSLRWAAALEHCSECILLIAMMGWWLVIRANPWATWWINHTIAKFSLQRSSYHTWFYWNWARSWQGWLMWQTGSMLQPHPMPNVFHMAQFALPMSQVTARTWSPFWWAHLIISSTIWAR